MEQKVMMMIRKFHVYASPNFAQQQDPALKPHVEKVFKKISSYGEDYEKDTQVHNMTMTSKKLKNHLVKRYNIKIVNKILSLFDWSNSLYYKAFYT
jgi:hypothetical protein